MDVLNQAPTKQNTVYTQHQQAHQGQASVTEQIPQNSTMNSSGNSAFKKFLIIFILLLILIAGGYLAFNLINKSSTTQVEDSNRTQIPSPAPRFTKTEFSSYQTIHLANTQGGTFTGTATRSVIPGKFFISVSTELPDPDEGSIYQAWLAFSQDNIIFLGDLTKDFNGQYTIVRGVETPTFTSFSQVLYNSLIVSLEGNSDETLETRILEGTFTQ